MFPKASRSNAPTGGTAIHDLCASAPGHARAAGAVGGNRRQTITVVEFFAEFLAGSCGLACFGCDDGFILDAERECLLPALAH